jgi:signal transduction histidine kinase
MRRATLTSADWCRPSGNWPAQLLRTSGFRLVLLYTGLFTVSVLVLLVMILWWGSTYVTQQTDEMVSDELGDVQSAAAKPGSGGLPRVVQTLSQRAGSRNRYLLEDRDGTVLAGNLPRIVPVPGVFTWYPSDSIFNFWPLASGVRGAGIRTADGNFLFVGRDTFALNEMRETVTQAFLSVVGATLLLALGGGLLMSMGSLRRVEEIGRAGQEIVATDLNRRVAVRGTGDEFDRLAMSLNAMLDRIQTLMEGLNQVSSDIAHDLRTPLTRLRQRLELGQRGESTIGSLRKSLEDAMRDVDGILETFGALLRIAQIEACSQEIEFTSVNVSALVEQLVEFYSPFAEEHGHTLYGSIEPGLRVNGDAELLTQALCNLIENAIRHSRAGAVQISAWRRARAVLVDVADPGPGIPPGFRDKVFQRFFRLERSRTTPGTGLGLSLVAAVVRMHHADVKFADDEDTFMVRVRFARVDAVKN